jgi:hypothetical protein
MYSELTDYLDRKEHLAKFYGVSLNAGAAAFGKYNFFLYWNNYKLLISKFYYLVVVLEM